MVGGEYRVASKRANDGVILMERVELLWKNISDDLH